MDICTLLLGKVHFYWQMSSSYSISFINNHLLSLKNINQLYESGYITKSILAVIKMNDEFCISDEIKRSKQLRITIK